MSRTFRILGISGSLRASSHNTALLNAFAAALPDGVEMEIEPIGPLPHFNSDLVDEVSLAAVAAFKEAVAGADAVLIATPEYNYSLPGVLKNALDWGSRPAYKSVFAGKPVGIVSAAAGGPGGARAQAHLRQVLTGMIAQIFPYPEFLVAQSFRKFDEDGKLLDEATQEHLSKYVSAFLAWIEKVG